MATSVRVLSVLSLYIGIVAIRWWPLPLHLGVQLPYIPQFECDRLYSTWALAWSSHALGTDPARLADANIYFPVRDALFYGPTGFGALVLFAPAYLLSGSPIVAINITFLAGIASTAWLLHLVVHRWARSHLAGMVAASIMLGNVWLTRTFVPTTPHLAVLSYWPLIIAAAASPVVSFGATLALWALALAQSLTDVVYVAPALLGPLALLGLVRLSRRPTRGTGLSLLLAALLAAASLLPVYRAHSRVAAKNPLLSQQTVWRQDPEGTVLPYDLVSPFRPFVIPPLAVLLLGAGALAVRRQGGPRDDEERRAWRAALFWTAAGGLLSLGPYVEVGSLGRLPTPQALLGGFLPLLGRARVPSRFGVAGVFGLAILCGLAFATVARAIDRRLGGGTLARGMSVMLAGAIVYGMIGYAGGVVPNRLPNVMPAPGQPPGTIVRALVSDGGPVVEIPPGTESSVTNPTRQAHAMFHSIGSWHPLLNGYSSYYPRGFVERMTLAAALPERSALDQLVGETGLRLVWVNTDRLSREAAERWQVVAGGDGGSLRLVADEGSDLLFAVELRGVGSAPKSHE
jgi:hypothetical protein